MSKSHGNLTVTALATATVAVLALPGAAPAQYQQPAQYHCADKQPADKPKIALHAGFRAEKKKLSKLVNTAP